MDEFDRVIVEALNESVPSTALPPRMVDRLVAHTRRRKRKRKRLLFFGFAIAAMGTMLTTAAIIEIASVSESVSQEDSLVAENSASDESASSEANASTVESAASESALSTSSATTSATATGGKTATSTVQQQKGEGKVKTTLRKASAVLAGAFALSSARLMSASSEEYQFIISGYPAEDVSYSADSDATSLVTGTLSAEYDAEELEARYRTWSDSPATSLNSRKYIGFSLIIK